MAEAAAAPATEAIASTSSAQAKFEAAKAHPLPSVATIKELFERFDFNKNKVLSLAEIDKVCERYACPMDGEDLTLSPRLCERSCQNMRTIRRR